MTRHCVEQIKIRKGKRTDSDAVRFAKSTFREMVSKKSLSGTPCVIRDSKDGKKIVSHRQTGYKFVYVIEEGRFVLITFAIHTRLDFEIGKLLKRLERYRLKASKSGSGNAATEF